MVGRAFFGHYMLAGIVVSLAAASGRSSFSTGSRRSGWVARREQRAAVLYLAMFPTALFLQAVYSESLYLLLVLAAFPAAERGRFALAGGLSGLAILTRVAGVALLPALAVLAWRARDRPRAFLGARAVDARCRRLSAGAVAAGGRPMGVLGRAGPLAPPPVARRPFRRDLGRSRRGWRAWNAVDTQTSSTRTHERRAAEVALAYFFLPLTVVAWRRFGAPYGLFAA